MPTNENDRLLEAVRLTSRIWDIAPAPIATDADTSDLFASLACLNTSPPDIELAHQHALSAVPKHHSFQQFLDRVRELHAFVNKPSAKPVSTDREGHHPDNKLG